MTQQSFLHRHRTHFGLSLRVTVAALATLTLGRALGFHMVLWAVLTAVILTQMSVGKSVQATLDYFLGTLGGAVYAGAIAGFVPHDGEAAFAGVLALAIAPLALLAAMSPRFAAAPTTAAIVVLAPTLIHTTSLVSAADRVLEVALGGATALAVSLLVFPTRARILARAAVAEMLDLVAQVLPEVVAGLTRQTDQDAVLASQRSIGAALMRLDAIRAEAQHEEIAFLVDAPDFDPLRRALLRLRHDLIMIGRVANRPLPATLHARLQPMLARTTDAAATQLRSCAAALRKDEAPRDTQALDRDFDALSAEIAALRREGSLRDLSVDAVEDVFALGFALEQWRRDLRELARRVAEHAHRPVSDDPET